MITKAIIEELDLNISNQYIDGTKIEANSNKYKFVWKFSTYHKKLDLKIKTLIQNMNFTYENNDYIKASELNI